MGAKTRTWRMSGWDSATMIDSICGEASIKLVCTKAVHSNVARSCAKGPDLYFDLMPKYY